VLRVAFRFDDPSPISKRWVEEIVIEACSRRKIPLTCAVIPAKNCHGAEVNFSVEQAKLFREAVNSANVEVALHGRLHCDAGKGVGGRPSEFEGIPLPTQMQWIATGRDLLQDALNCRVRGFVPPWNGYDVNTIRALTNLGFSYLSADIRIPPAISEDLRIIPLTCNLRGLIAAIAQARVFERFSPVIVAVMHHYDFDRDSDDPPCQPYKSDEFSELLDKLLVEPRIEFCTLREIADSTSAKSNRVWPLQERIKSALPYRFKRSAPSGCVLTRLIPSVF